MDRSVDQLFVGLQEHCAILSKALIEIVEGDIDSGFFHAAEWLEFAAGVCTVEVLTARFDSCLMYCGNAVDYEDARSELFSRIATELTIFQFTWSAFETLSKSINPPSIPKTQRFRGADALCQRVIFYLKQTPPVDGYESVINHLKKSVPSSCAHPGFDQEALPLFMGRSGIGINFVREVRNEFAHGAARLPEPDDSGDRWCGKKSRFPEQIRICSRVVLLTIQMLLCAYFGNKHFPLSLLRDRDMRLVEADIHQVLCTLHLKSEDGSKSERR